MGKWFYDWEDAGDELSSGVPYLGRYPEYRCKTKADVRREWKSYLEMLEEDLPSHRTPKLRAWRISYEEVKV